MKRLLIFHPAPAPYRVDFFNEIGRRFCLHIVFLRREAEEVLVAQQKLLEGATFTYEYIPYHFRVLGRDIGFGYTKILRKFRPDVVIATEFSMSLLVPLLLRSFAGFKYKVLTQCDDSIFMAEARTGGRRRRANWMLRRADGMITISREVSEWYLRNTSVKRAIEFPIIHDETAFSEHRSEIQQMAASHIRRFSLAGHRVGLFVGRFVEVKNLPLLLRVLAQVNPRLPSDWRFVLVGDGDEAPILHQQVAGVLGLDSIAQPVREHRAGHDGEIPRQPPRKVQRVNGLVDQRGAALAGPLAPPTVRAIVFLCGIGAVPDDEGAAAGKAAQSAGRDQLLHPAGGRVIAVLEADSQLAFGFRRGFGHRFGFRGVQAHRARAACGRGGLHPVGSSAR